MFHGVIFISSMENAYFSIDYIDINEEKVH
jgi:hypothetical protein